MSKESKEFRSNKFSGIIADKIIDDTSPILKITHKRSDECRVRNLNSNIDYIVNRFGEGSIYDEYLTSLRAERDRLVKRIKEKEND